jgi:hypothetical protein
LEITLSMFSAGAVRSLASNTSSEGMVWSCRLAIILKEFELGGPDQLHLKPLVLAICLCEMLRDAMALESLESCPVRASSVCVRENGEVIA